MPIAGQSLPKRLISHPPMMNEDRFRLFKVPVRPRRFYDCRYYLQCLDRAARTLEPSLPCKGCSRYQPIDLVITPAEIDGIVNLWRAVFWNWGDVS